MRSLLFVALLSIAQFAKGTEPLPIEVSPLSLGREIPATLNVIETIKPFRGWSFDNEIGAETAKEMWHRFLPQVPLESRVQFSLLGKQIAEVQFLIHTDKPLALGKSVERELSKRYGKPRITRLRAVEGSCPSELVRKWNDDRTTLILVSGVDYSAVYISIRQNDLARNITSKKQNYYSEVLQGEPCLRW